MKKRLMLLVCVLVASASAQNAADPGDSGLYPGLGVLSRGSANIGSHSGEQLDLRLYGSIDTTYDTGIQPFALDSHGKLVQVNGLAGIEAAVGAYGVHSWRRAQLGLDYRGTFRHYLTNSFYDGSDQTLKLGYSVQPNRRFGLDARAVAGTSSLGLTGPLSGYLPVENSTVQQPTLLLFDNRTNFFEGGLDASFFPTPRTTITAGGSGSIVDRRATGLASMNSYDLHGSVMRRISRSTSIGGEYRHTHYDFPGTFGESDINTYTLRVTQEWGRAWSASLSAGVFQSDVEGLQNVSFDPVVSTLLGVPAGIQAFFSKGTFPTGEARVTRKFRSSQIVGYYSMGAGPGNGVYLTSRQTNGGFSVSYTGIRKFSFSLGGNYSNLIALGQSLQKYTQFGGGAGVTYSLFGGLHATARYDARDQAIDLYGYHRSSYRAAVGLSYSPGTLPLSLW